MFVSGKALAAGSLAPVRKPPFIPARTNRRLAPCRSLDLRWQDAPATGFVNRHRPHLNPIRCHPCRGFVNYLIRNPMASAVSIGGILPPFVSGKALAAGSLTLVRKSPTIPARTNRRLAPCRSLDLRWQDAPATGFINRHRLHLNPIRCHPCRGFVNYLIRNPMAAAVSIGGILPPFVSGEALAAGSLAPVRKSPIIPARTSRRLAPCRSLFLRWQDAPATGFINRHRPHLNRLRLIQCLLPSAFAYWRSAWPARQVAEPY